MTSKNTYGQFEDNNASMLVRELQCCKNCFLTWHYVGGEIKCAKSRSVSAREMKKAMVKGAFLDKQC